LRVLAAATGDRFDSHKVLLDPYARKIFFPPAFSRDASRGPGSNAGKAPLARLPRSEPRPPDGGPRPRHTSDYWEDLDFTVQEGQAAEWNRVVDTSLASPSDFSASDTEPRLASTVYRVKSSSIVVLLRAA
jgi:hypothetical protein